MTMSDVQTLRATVAAPGPAPEPQIYTFGEPESVLDRREIFDLFQVTHNNRWYEPPVSMAGIGRAYRMAPHHQSAILLKRNLLVSSFVASRWLTKADFARWALDWLIFGNAYLENVPNFAGRPAALRPSPAAFTRVGVKPGQFWFVRSDLYYGDEFEFEVGKVHHMAEPDPMQEIYGMPEYLSALQSGLLNESATIFRRRYYLNGSHAGFILYVSEEGLTQDDSQAIRNALKQSKGPGNFRNLYVHIPKGKKDGIQLMPVGEMKAADEFLNIKDITAQDMLAAHRTPPQLLGIVPKNAGGFGNVIDAARTFYELEIMPIMSRMMEVNDWLGLQAVVFEDLRATGMLASAGKAPPALAG